MKPTVNAQLDLFPEWQLKGEKHLRVDLVFQFYKCDVTCDGKKHWTNSWVTGRLTPTGIDCYCQEVRDEIL